MVWKHLDHKVPGGKLLRIDADIEQGIIRDIKITGDFFMHPEDTLGSVEEIIIGKSLDGTVLKKALAKSLEGVTMVGLTTDDIVIALVKLKSS
jgi:lipoate---protein ligase